MEKYTLKRSGKRPITFVGEVIASAGTSSNEANPDYSGQTGISHSANVYRTDSGKFVLEYVVFSQWVGQDDQYYVHVADTVEEIVSLIEEATAPRVANALIDRLADVVDIAERVT